MIKFFDPLDVSHERFKEMYHGGMISLTIDTNAASYLFESALSEYAGGQANYRALGFGGFIYGCIAIFFIGWWSLLGFAVGVAGFRLSRRHADKSVISAALGCSEIYALFARERILAYRDR